MTTESNTYKFLRISTKGFIPFELGSKANLQVNHPFFVGKSDEECNNAFVDGHVDFSFYEYSQEAGKTYICPTMLGGGYAFNFLYPDLLVAPAKAESRIENGILEICLDLRIDVKSWASPSQMNAFLALLSNGGFTGVRWELQCTFKEGGRKLSMRMETQSFDSYQIERFKTKKLLLAAV